MQEPTRRDLFCWSAAALAAGDLDVGTAAAGTAPPRRWQPKKAVKYGMIQAGDSVRAKFDLLRECGYDGVELDSPGAPPRDEVLAAAAATGLSIPGVVDSVHWGKPLSSADAAVRAEGRKALEHAIGDAAAFGCTSVLLVPAVVRKDTPYADAWQRSQQEIRAVLPLAQEKRIMILIENVWNGFLLGPTELQRYVDEFASDWVGVHFDPGNLVKLGWPEHWVPILGKRIRKVDVKDYHRQKQTFDVLLNEGDADWPTLVAELKKVGYDGWFTAEMKGGDGAWLKDLAQRMDSFLHA